MIVHIEEPLLCLPGYDVAGESLETRQLVSTLVNPMAGQRVKGQRRKTNINSIW